MTTSSASGNASIGPGAALPAYEIDVDPEKMKTMAAILADPNPIHFDTRATAELGMGDRPINQGPLNMGYVMTMLASFAGGRDRIRHFRVRFLGNVYGGDRVRAEGEIVAIHDQNPRPVIGDAAKEPVGGGASEGDRGLCAGMRWAECEVRLVVLDPAGGEPRPVLAGTALVLLPENPSEREA